MGGRGGADPVVRRAGGAVAQADPAAGAGQAPVLLPQPARGHRLRGHRRRVVRHHRLRGVCRRAGGDGQPGADVRLRHLLGRPRVREPAVRERLRAVQPVARSRARRGLGGQDREPRLAARAHRVPALARPLARGGRDPLLRLARARLLEQGRPFDAVGARAGLRGDPARGHEHLRHRHLDRTWRRVRGLLRLVRPGGGVRAARRRAVHPGAAVARCSSSTSCRARSRCCA